jgi:hypothetical protein
MIGQGDTVFRTLFGAVPGEVLATAIGLSAMTCL